VGPKADEYHTAKRINKRENIMLY